MPSPKSDPSACPPTSEARHTPGPWKIRKHTGEGEVCSIYGGRDGYVTVFGERSYCGRSDESVYAEVEANARLIAAAPELLAAAEMQQAETKWLDASPDQEDGPMEEFRSLCIRHGMDPMDAPCEFLQTFTRSAIAAARGGVA